jgi:hypothetical protein
MSGVVSPPDAAELHKGPDLVVTRIGAVAGGDGLGFLDSRSAGMLVGTTNGIYRVSDRVELLKQTELLVGFSHHQELGLVTVSDEALISELASDSLSADMGFLAGRGGRVYLGSDGSFWVTGATRVRNSSGTCLAAPVFPGTEAVIVPMSLDIYGNLWSLTPFGDSLGVLPVALEADRTEWQAPPAAFTVPIHSWEGVVADHHGAIWLHSDRRLLRADLRSPAGGWLPFHNAPGFPDVRISAASVSPNGSILVGLANGDLVECDIPVSGSKQVTVYRTEIGREVDHLVTEPSGDLLVLCTDTIYRIRQRGASRTWSVGGLMPFSNHDLRGLSFQSRFYVAGGRTAEYGLEPAAHDSDDIFSYDPESGYVLVVAKLKQPRLYNALADLDGELWVIGGNTPIAGEDNITNSVEIWNPVSGQVRDGPGLSKGYNMPVARTINDRIYVVGSPGADWKGMEAFNVSHVESIGLGEDNWRRETDCPVPIMAATSCELDGHLYLMVQDLGLISFDPDTGQWDVDLPALPGGAKPRSPQMAAHDGRIWSIGGRDLPNGTEVYSYDPSLGIWESHPEFPRQLAWGAGGTLGERLVVFGGAAGRNYSNLVYESPVR